MLREIKENRKINFSKSYKIKSFAIVILIFIILLCKSCGDNIFIITILYRSVKFISYLNNKFN